MSAGPAPSETLGKIPQGPSKLLVVAGNPWCSWLAAASLQPLLYPHMTFSLCVSPLFLLGHPSSCKFPQKGHIHRYQGLGLLHIILEDTIQPMTPPCQKGPFQSQHSSALATDPPGFWLSLATMALIKVRAVESKILV